MALNDDKKHIWYLNIVWPVSVYNERLWSKSSLTILTVISLLVNIFVV
jgi:hypothetical protein